MQKEGIGRPSTYATTVEKLLDEKRKYVISENGSLVPSERGIMLLQEIAPMYGNDGKRGVFESNFTARMEDSLDGIEHGGLKHQMFGQTLSTSSQNHTMRHWKKGGPNQHLNN